MVDINKSITPPQSANNFLALGTVASSIFSGYQKGKREAKADNIADEDRMQRRHLFQQKKEMMNKEYERTYGKQATQIWDTEQEKKLAEAQASAKEAQDKLLFMDLDKVNREFTLSGGDANTFNKFLQRNPKFNDYIAPDRDIKNIKNANFEATDDNERQQAQNALDLLANSTQGSDAEAIKRNEELKEFDTDAETPGVQLELDKLSPEQVKKLNKRFLKFTDSKGNTTYHDIATLWGRIGYGKYASEEEKKKQREILQVSKTQSEIDKNTALAKKNENAVKFGSSWTWAQDKISELGKIPRDQWTDPQKQEWQEAIAIDSKTAASLMKEQVKTSGKYEIAELKANKDKTIQELKNEGPESEQMALAILKDARKNGKPTDKEGIEFYNLALAKIFPEGKKLEFKEKELGVTKRGQDLTYKAALARVEATKYGVDKNTASREAIAELDTASRERIAKLKNEYKLTDYDALRTATSVDAINAAGFEKLTDIPTNNVKLQAHAETIREVGKLSTSEKKPLIDNAPIVALASGASELTPEDIGIADNFIRSALEYTNANLEGQENLAMFNTLKAEWRHKLFGATLTAHELKASEETLGNLKTNFIPVMQRLKAQLKNVKAAYDRGFTSGSPAKRMVWAEDVGTARDDLEKSIANIDRNIEAYKIYKANPNIGETELQGILDKKFGTETGTKEELSTEKKVTESSSNDSKKSRLDRLNNALKTQAN